MKKIPTAEEIIKEHYPFLDENECFSTSVFKLEQLVIEFAKMHVEAALKAASENAETEEEAGNPYDPNDRYYVVDKESILNSYPLDNIK